VEGALRSRDFRLLVVASGLSSLGDELALIALTLKVASTYSGLAVAALLLAGLLPLVLFAPSAGVIVDNFETTRTLAVATAFQAVVALGLAFASGLPVLLMLAFLLGTGLAVANPSLYTLVPAVVGDEHATAGNAYLETARYGGMILGPVLAGTITAIAGSGAAMLVDSGTFVLIALAALALTVRRRPDNVAEEGTKGEARAGLGVIRRDALLAVAFTVFAAVILFAAMDNVAEVFFAQQNLMAGAWGYGLLASAWLGGLVIGAALIARRLPDRRLVPALLGASVVLGVAVGAAAAIAVLIPALILFAVGGAANGVQSVSMRSLIVHRVEDRYRGRVFAAYGGLANGMQLVATAMAGGLLTVLSGRTVLMIGGIGCAAAGLLGVLWYRLLPAEIRETPEREPPGRHMHVTVPDSGPVMRLPDAPPPVDATSDQLNVAGRSS
jgi:MFS family permease